MLAALSKPIVVRASCWLAVAMVSLPSPTCARCECARDGGRHCTCCRSSGASGCGHAMGEANCTCRPSAREADSAGACCCGRPASNGCSKNAPSCCHVQATDNSQHEHCSCGPLCPCRTSQRPRAVVVLDSEVLERLEWSPVVERLVPSNPEEIRGALYTSPRGRNTPCTALDRCISLSRFLC